MTPKIRDNLTSNKNQAVRTTNLEVEEDDSKTGDCLEPSTKIKSRGQSLTEIICKKRRTCKMILNSNGDFSLVCNKRRKKKNNQNREINK